VAALGQPPVRHSADRRRRVSQFQENVGVPTRNFNVVLSDIIAQNREIWDKTNDMTGRGLFSQPGNTVGPLPLPSVCSSAFLAFDATGLNPVCVQISSADSLITPGSVVNGDFAVWSGTNGKALADGGSFASPPPIGNVPPNTGFFTNIPFGGLNSVTSAYTITTSDCGKTVQAGTGSTGFFVVGVPSPGGFPSVCPIVIVNGDTSRGKGISNDPGCSDRSVLWMGQACEIGIVNGAWAVLSRPGRYKPPANTTLNFYSDFVNGVDTAGSTDGLAPGASAFKSAEMCFLNAADQIDYNGAAQTQVRCNMAAATADTQGMHVPVHGLVGAQGGAAFQIVGASLAVSGAVNDGSGHCLITVPSNATYVNNQIVSVYGILGATTCNGTWAVGRDGSNQLTLLGTTFSGTYTSGGTITNGSSFNTTGVDAVDCYFGSVLQFYNVTFISSSNDIGVLWGCKVYLQAGNSFGPSGGAQILANFAGSQVHFEADIGLSGSATTAFVLASNQGLILTDIAMSINLIPSTSFAFGSGFAVAINQGQANFSQVTINANGSLSASIRCNAGNLGLVISNTGSANTYFPGSSNCTTNNGGVVN
jgi:hypothetical protein